MAFNLSTRAQLLIVPEVCLNYDLKVLLHQNPRGYYSLQQIITVCGSCNCEEMCTFCHDLLHRQTPGPESRSFQIMPSIWCSHHCLFIIAAGKPFNLARVLCISDATAPFGASTCCQCHRAPVKSEHGRLWVTFGAEHRGPASQFQSPQHYPSLTWSWSGCSLRSCLKRTPTSPEGRTLAVLKLASVLGWSPELRGWIPPGLKWSNCTMKSVERHLLLKKMEDVRDLCVSHSKTSNNFDYWYTKKECSTRDNSLLLALLSGCKGERKRKCVLVAKLAATVQQHSQSNCFILPSLSVISLIYLPAMQLSPVDNSNFVKRWQRFCRKPASYSYQRQTVGEQKISSFSLLPINSPC